MIKVAKEFNLLTKEHNGDYIESSVIRSKFTKGLDAINIAPEFGRMETECYLERLDESQFQRLFQICYESKTWVKWSMGDDSFDPFSNKDRLIKVCGHYVFSDKMFIDLVKDIHIVECLFEKMNKRVNDIMGKL